MSLNVERTVQNILENEIRTPEFQKPQEIGCFSYSDDRKLLLNDSSSLVTSKILDNSSQKVFYEPDLPIDLNKGYDSYEWQTIGDEHLNGLLDIVNELKLKNEALWKQSPPNFVLWRGILTKIMCTPYDKSPFYLNIIMRDNVFYIEQRKEGQETFNNEDHKLQTYRGYKFETFCCMDQNRKNNEDTKVNILNEFGVVFKTKLAKNRIIIGAEVDACKDLKKRDYIELKTHKVLATPKDIFNFNKYKLLKFWAQSYLAGIKVNCVLSSALFKELYVGFKQSDGSVHSIEPFNVLKIPTLAHKEHKNLWDFKVCLSFADAFFEWCKSQIKDQGLVFIIEYDGTQFKMTKSDNQKNDYFLY